MVPNPVDKHGLVTRNRSADYEKFPLIQHDLVLCVRLVLQRSLVDVVFGYF